jgi:hypothetical protein
MHGFFLPSSRASFMKIRYEFVEFIITVDSSSKSTVLIELSAEMLMQQSKGV